MYDIILASGSPRRREIMDKVGLKYTVIKSEKEEDMSGHDPKVMVEMLSRMKAEDVSSKDEVLNSDRFSDCIIIGADTVVAYKDSILGKPHSEQQAFDMLRMLSDNTHHVHTGVCILKVEDHRIVKTVNFSVSTAVNITPMTDDEIHAYIATGEPMDKAGAYAIQGCFAPYVSGIEGDYYNIVGFPISRIYEELKKL